MRTLVLAAPLILLAGCVDRAAPEPALSSPEEWGTIEVDQERLFEACADLCVTWGGSDPTDPARTTAFVATEGTGPASVRIRAWWNASPAIEEMEIVLRSAEAGSVPLRGASGLDATVEVERGPTYVFDFAPADGGPQAGVRMHALLDGPIRRAG